MNANSMILVTRPSPQGNALCTYLEKKGEPSYFFPTIEIVPIARIILKDKWQELKDSDWLVFMSPQAVPPIQQFLQQNPLPKLAAIGSGTADALKKINLKVDAIPSNYSSEGLLDLETFQTVKNLKITIIQGQNGRDFLLSELLSRGANTNTLVVYKRIKPGNPNTKPLLDLLKKKKIDIIICTSGDNLRNLVELVGDVNRPLLNGPKLLVTSKRIAQIAQELSFNNIVFADNASDEAIFQGIKNARRS